MFLRLDKTLKYLANNNSICYNCNRKIITKHIILYCTKYEKAGKELNEKNESHMSTGVKVFSIGYRIMHLKHFCPIIKYRENWCFSIFSIHSL